MLIVAYSIYWYGREIVTKAKLCAYPGCFQMAVEGTRYCTEHANAPKPPCPSPRSWGNRSRASVYRSSEWRRLSRQAIEQAGCCAICGSTDRLEAHHISPDPELALDPHNIVVLCKVCHARVTSAEIASNRQDRITVAKKRGARDEAPLAISRSRII